MGSDRWNVFIPSTDRERMGSDLTERLTGHLRRLEAEVAAANEEIARLKAQRDADALAIRSHQENANRLVEQHATAHAATTAKLGRAVAAVRDGMAAATQHPAVEEWYRERAAILADDGSKAAGEAWMAERAVIEAAKPFRTSGVPHEHWVRLWDALDALAKVDARRGSK